MYKDSGELEQTIEYQQRAREIVLRKLGQAKTEFTSSLF